MLKKTVIFSLNIFLAVAIPVCELSIKCDFPAEAATATSYGDDSKYSGFEEDFDPDATDENGLTKLHYVAEHGQYEIAKKLIENNAAIDLPDNYGWTPLHRAASNGNEEIVYILIENGANVDAIDKSTWTPGHFAAANGHFDIVKKLIDSGANINYADGNGVKPIDEAIRRGRLNVVNLIETHNAKTTKTKEDTTTESEPFQNDHTDQPETTTVANSYIEQSLDHQIETNEISAFFEKVIISTL